MLAAVLKGRDIRSLSGSDLGDLVTDLTKRDPSLEPLARARRDLQLQLLLAKLSTEQLQEAAAVITADPAQLYTGSLGTFIGAMTARNPTAAMAWAKEQKNPGGFVGQVIAAMAKDHPQEAMDTYRSALLDGTMGTETWWEASFGVGSAVAKLGARQLLEFVDGIPRGQQSSVLANCTRDLPEGERVAMADEMYRRYQAGEIEEWGFRNSLSALGTADPAKLGQWLDKLPAGKDRARVMLDLATSGSRGGENSAMTRTWMSKAIADMPGNEKELLQQLRSSAFNNPSDFATFAEALPPSVEIKAADLMPFARNSLSRGPAALVDMARAIQDPAEQAELIVTTLDTFRTQTESSSNPPRMNGTDFEILRHRLRTLNLTGDAATRLADAFDAAKDARQKPKE